MQGKEGILCAVITDELKEVNKNLTLFGHELVLPEADSWKSKDALTLSKFLSEHPLPSDPAYIPLYGIAWELNWGHKPPTEITKAREELVTRNRFSLGEIGDMEEIWLNLIASDAELF